MAGSLRRAATAYYANLSSEEKGLVSDFFKSLDANGDGKITLPELLERSKKNMSGKREEYSSTIPDLFEVLDLDGDGNWDYDDAVTCYYMCKTGRLYTCDGCGIFLIENYFTCIKCFNQKSFDLCSDCYHYRRFQHHTDAVFYDNFELLYRFRQPTEASSSTKVQENQQPRKSSSSKREKFKQVVDVLNLGMGILQLFTSANS